MKFAVFFMGEYAAMFLFSGIAATVFLGGYNALPINFGAIGMPTVELWMHRLAPLVFIAKCLTGIIVFIWIRATLPRLRYDQLMSLGWKSLLPLAVFNFMVVATWILMTSLYGPSGGWAAAGLALVGVLLFLTSVAKASKADLSVLDSRTVRLTEGGATK